MNTNLSSRLICLYSGGSVFVHAGGKIGMYECSASKHVLVLLPYLYHQDYELLIYVYWSGILVHVVSE